MSTANNQEASREMRRQAIVEPYLLPRPRPLRKEMLTSRNKVAPQPGRFPAYPQSTSQQVPQLRSANLQPSRVQNVSKAGNSAASTWGFGALTTGPSALDNATARLATGTTASFAQTIGGSPATAPLDLSEFPSLSGNPHPQVQNNNSTTWQRSGQQTSVARPVQASQVITQYLPHTSQQRSQANPPLPQSSRHLATTSPSNEGAFVSSNHTQNSLEDYRHGQVPEQAQMLRQAPGQNADEFPPLSGLGSTDSSTTENRSFSQITASNALGALQSSAQARHGALGSHSTVMEANHSARLPSNIARPPAGTVDAPESHQGSFDFPRSTAGQHTRGGYDHQLSGDLNAGSQGIDKMPEIDRWGLAGVLTKFRSEDPLTSSLARGRDLTQMGLELNSQQSLWNTWGGPFADGTARPLQPDFTLPDCYTVTNIHRVREKLPGFTDETLFWIFYTQPRDIIQELAASELTNRNWRYHKFYKMWLTKDPSLPEPRRLTDEAEQGSYLFFNHRNWEKMRHTDFLLEYNHLAPTNGRSVTA